MRKIFKILIPTLSALTLATAITVPVVIVNSNKPTEVVNPPVENKYTVTLNFGDLKEASTYTVDNNTFNLRNLNTDVEGYTFKGFYKDAEYKEKIDTETIDIKANTTLYLKYEKIAETEEFSITIEYGIANPITLKANKDVKINLDNHKIELDGYTFEGFYSDSEYENPVSNDYVVTKNATIYAKYLPVNVELETYNITVFHYFEDKSEVASSETFEVKENSEFSIANHVISSKDAYYINCFTDENMETPYGYSSFTVTGDLILYYKYKKVEQEKENYLTEVKLVEFKDGSPFEIATGYQVEKETGSELDLSAYNSEVDNYTFDGYYVLNKNGELVKLDDSNVVISDEYFLYEVGEQKTLTFYLNYNKDGVKILNSSSKVSYPLWYEEDKLLAKTDNVYITTNYELSDEIEVLNAKLQYSDKEYQGVVENNIVNFEVPVMDIYDKNLTQGTLTLELPEDVVLTRATNIDFSLEGIILKDVIVSENNYTKLNVDAFIGSFAKDEGAFTGDLLVYDNIEITNRDNYISSIFYKLRSNAGTIDLNGKNVHFNFDGYYYDNLVGTNYGVIKNGTFETSGLRRSDLYDSNVDYTLVKAPLTTANALVDWNYGEISNLKVVVNNYGFDLENYSNVNYVIGYNENSDVRENTTGGKIENVNVTINAKFTGTVENRNKYYNLTNNYGFIKYANQNVVVMHATIGEEDVEFEGYENQTIKDVQVKIINVEISDVFTKELSTAYTNGNYYYDGTEYHKCNKYKMYDNYYDEVSDIASATPYYFDGENYHQGNAGYGTPTFNMASHNDVKFENSLLLVIDSNNLEKEVNLIVDATGVHKYSYIKDGNQVTEILD